MTDASLHLFEKVYSQDALIFKKTFDKVSEEFGELWREEFAGHLHNIFGANEERHRKAVKGYTKFALDAMRLQSLFNKKKAYEDVTYDEALEKVYLNEDYMMELYLPGILVSHFLWRHHYKQYLYYREKFLPLLAPLKDKSFYDVGTGTGFYTLQILRSYPEAVAFGVDISPHSRRFTRETIKAFGLEERLNSINANIITETFEPRPIIQCVEVLEHLTDPQLFLNHLRKMLIPGGVGFITAALTAPNADHIYLYWTPEEVIKQLEQAGFIVKDYMEESAYEPKDGEYAPKVAAFIVS